MKFKSYSMISLLFAAALSSCSQVEELAPSVEDTYAYTFQVADDDLTKASFGEDHIVFEKGDLVASYALTSANQSAPVDVAENGEKIITVKSSVALKAGDKVYAYYPYNPVNDNASKTEVTLEIPKNQVSGDADAMPMVALPLTLTDAVNSNEATEVGTLYFRNLGSIIKLSIYSTDSKFQGETIQGVTFVEDKPVAGSFTYDIANMDILNPAAISGYTETSVTVAGNGVVGTNETDGGVLYMVVAPGKYKGKFIIHTNMADYTYDSSDKEREYSRATLKPLNINLASTNWVAADKYDNSIDSPRELVAFLKGTSAEDTDDYTISADLDMTGYAITSASGFGGTLNGGDFTISNLVSSVPMFAQNSGTISNLNIDATCSFTPAVTCKQFGAVVGLDNGGTYNSISTAATIKITAEADIESNIALGGIVGASNSKTGSVFNSCSNTGSITVDATNYTHWPIAIGGIVGWVRKAAFNECENSAPLTLTALYHKPFHQWSYVTSDDTSYVDTNTSVGGIVGMAWDISSGIPNSGSSYTDEAYGGYYEKCKNNAGGAITVTHSAIHKPSNDKTDIGLISAGGIVGQGNGYVNNGQNWAPISVTAVGDPPAGDYWGRQQSCVQVGGIAGKSYQGIGMNSCTNRGEIYVVCDQSYCDKKQYMSSVGGLCGNNGYNKETSNMRFSTNHGKITVRGWSSINVGGICGTNGSQRGNRVYNTATIDVQARNNTSVGGLLGFANGSKTNQYIKTSYCEADVKGESVLSSRYEVCVGGLIGSWGTGSTVDNPSLTPYGSDSYRCHYTGNVVSEGQLKVGMVIGWIVEDNKKIFGSADTPIQVSGTLKRSGMDSPVEINSTNVAEYAIGSIKAGTVDIYVESPNGGATAEVKVMSLNIGVGQDNWTGRKAPIVSMIAGETPDIIGLQEVGDLDTWDAWKEGGQPWKYLTDNLTAFSGYRQDKQTNAFLYNPEVLEVSNVGLFYLSDNYSTSGIGYDPNYQRTAQYATCRHIASNEHFFFINTHYPLNWDGCTKSTALIDQLLPDINPGNYPVIMVGDFNCTKSSGAFDLVEKEKKTMRDASTYAASFYSDENKALKTYNAFGEAGVEVHKIDHIWYSYPALVAKYYEVLTQDIRKYGEVEYLSDHYPITAVFSI